ncbi:response regulator transcription factor [Hyphobacterium indicum]|jgi:DNA-binding NarL/FixJ family response regulator|uniref:response regulator transcription factor n=1 Tax=Hyphobacterium indicum TaxID=2162714 RepID=UPI000D647C2A|nr:response regulator transcription factor [Hyphobacterium indicum]
MTRVLIVEDIADVRAWLSDVMISACPDARIETAADTRSARARLGREPYDLALVDLGLPDGSGFDVLRAIKAESPGTLCVVATILGDDASIVGALAAGADGYLLKDQPGDLLARHIRQILDGLPALSPAIARRIMDHFRKTGPAAPDAELTSRERDVLAQIGRGLRNHEAAAALGISEHTVAAHIKSVYRKLDISSRAEAAWHAARLGL